MKTRNEKIKEVVAKNAIERKIRAACDLWDIHFRLSLDWPFKHSLMPAEIHRWYNVSGLAISLEDCEEYLGELEDIAWHLQHCGVTDDQRQFLEGVLAHSSLQQDLEVASARQGVEI